MIMLTIMIMMMVMRLKRTMAFAFAALALSTLTSACRAAEHPSLFLSRDDFARIVKSADPRHQRAVSATLEQAGKLAGETIDVPAEGGGWIFYLYCPKHDALLRRLAPGEFECPVDHEAFEGERYEACYRTTLHDRAAAAAETLALAYQFSGDERYARKATEILLKYADVYGGYVRHDRWGRVGAAAFMGGMRYAQALDEAVNTIPCAWAYDLIYTSGALTDEQRQHIERDFLRAAARQLEVPTFQHDNNHQTWLNAGIASVGFTLGDQRLIDESITGEHGFQYQMGKLVTVDGLWIEGTMAYQGYAMQPAVMHAEMARRAGLDIAHEPHLKSLFDGPIDSAFPDGSFPIINDSDPYQLSSLADLYEWAYAIYGDKPYGVVAAMGTRSGRWAWMVGQPELPAGNVLPQSSRNLSGIGYLFLQRPMKGDAVSAVLDYGPHGGGHGHPDKLNLILYALGKVLFVDPGRISYSVPEYKEWCKQTVAHNTVVIDSKSQEPTTGECLWFVHDEQFDAACVRSDKAYPGVDLRRVVAITDNYILDCYQVDSVEEHQIDWLLHVRGKPMSVEGFAPAQEPPGTENGYQYLSNVQQRAVADVAGFAWQLDGKHTLRLVAVAPAPETWFSGEGVGTSLGDRVPFLLRRARGKRASFGAVYQIADPATEPIKGFECEAAKDGNAFVVRVVGEESSDTWRLPLTPEPKAQQREPQPPQAVNGLSFERALR